MKDQDPLTELRLYRDLGRRRDPMIRRAAKAGYSQRRIALASGLGLRRVQQILGRNFCDPSASTSLDD